MTETRVYYKIRFPKRAGERWGEWHQSNSGTDKWGSVAKVRAILTSGIRKGYHGRIVEPFSDYEVVKFTETVSIEREVVTL